MRKLCWPMLIAVSLLLLLTGCSLFEQAGEDKEATIDPHPTNADQADVPIDLSAYAEEIGVNISEPLNQVFSTEKSFTLAGDIRDAAQLKGSYVWVLMNGPQSGTFDYYIPIEAGRFEQELTLFEGEGTYAITVRVPDKEKEDRFFDITTLEVTNESAEITRDIAYLPIAIEAAMQLTNPTIGFTEVNGSMSVQGTVDDRYTGNNIMIKQRKDGESSEEVWPITDGAFSGELPLHFGAGMYDVTIMLPDLTRDNYFLEAATIAVDNTSATVTEPIEFYKNYYEQKFQLDFPKAGGLQTGETFRIAGRFDPSLERNREVEQLIVITKKDGVEASYLIPVTEGKFDDVFWLRFGPGEYEVTLNVPTNPGAQQSYFEFAGVAKFTVYSDASDQRYLMPSRGIEADAPVIGELAKDLTRGKKNERAKAKAVYEYVAKTVKYDVQKLQNDAFKLDDSALKTLETKKGVCQDYAFLAVALLRAVGIEARYIGGTAQSGSFGARHAWVEAKVDGKWLVMDPTWGAGYVQDGKFVANYDDAYFDPDPQQFAKTHTREEEIY